MIYAWIWKKLPGPKWVKVLIAAQLILIALFILWFLVFPNVQSYFSGDPSVNKN